MSDTTNYNTLSPKQRKKVREYMNSHNVTENKARHMLGYVPGDLQQISVMEALEMIKERNPDKELTNETLKFYLNEIMKMCIPKPNPKLAMKFLISNVKPIICPDCGYEIATTGYDRAIDIELIGDKKSAIMCPYCFSPVEK